MSIATPYRLRLDDPGYRADHHDEPTATPRLHDRAVAAMHHIALDRRLAAGAITADDRDLTVRAWQITRPSERARLATRLEAILLDAERPRAALSARVPVCRHEVKAARSEILRLAARLRDPRPVRPRGVARLRLLLTDGTGPLYVAGPNDELYRQLHRATLALG